MSRWFRFYDDAINDPKILKLSEKTFRVWVGLLCLASKNEGVLPPFEDMALLLRMKREKLQPELETLITSGLFDHTDDGIIPHNWTGRQYKSDVSTERVKRFRNGQRNVSETPPDTETEQSRIRGARADALSSPDWPKDFREQFWERYPNKVGKPVALQKLERIKRRGDVRWAELIDGLDAYIRNKPIDRDWLNPATFLNQERWRDQPAAKVLPIRRTPDA